MNNGATIWSRDTIQSEIFFYKPDKWFKIWFYIVNKVNHKDNKLFKRSENLITYSEIMSAVRCSRTVVHKCIKYLKLDNMIDTRKTTRGMIISVNNYDKYQILDNYKTTAKTSQRQVRDKSKATTINKNVKNEKNVKKDTRPTEKDFLEISEKYKVPLSFVRSKWDDLLNYCESKGKKYKNYKSALSSWVKKDAIERIENARSGDKKAGLDFTNI